MRSVRAVCWLAVSLLWLLSAGVLSGQTSSQSLTSPFGAEHAVVSPDQRQALFGTAQNNTFWLENLRSGQRKPLLNGTVQTMSAGWSPDSSAFFVNDRETSDEEHAFVYRAATLDRLDLRSLIVAAYPQAARFFAPGQLAGSAPAPGLRGRVPDHSFVHGMRWLDTAHVEVAVTGHTGGASAGETILPSLCFNLRYRVSTAGEVRKLSQRIATAGSPACDAQHAG